MRIAIVGGGPAGLYLAILMKKRDPSHEIIVFERNAPDDTFGWGVVFSDETLGHFEAADRPTHDEITRALRALGRHRHPLSRRGASRSGGHGFSAIAPRRCSTSCSAAPRARRRAALQQRGRRRRGARAEYDLVVAADGVNSAVRRALAAALRAALDGRGANVRLARHRRRFDAFTFFFEQTEHGIFQVHAYPFSDTRARSSSSATRRRGARAGLDEATRTRPSRICEKLFADELDGHKLLTNRSLWIDFPTVRNESWHTATSCSSATPRTRRTSRSARARSSRWRTRSRWREALRDRGATTSPAALAAYEAERRPSVEAHAARRAGQPRWFENIKRYMRPVAARSSRSTC